MARKLVSFLCTIGSVLMGAGVVCGEVNNSCTSSSDCNRNCYIGTCVFVVGGGGTCEYSPIVCDDGDPCTDDKCKGGVCRFVERLCNVDNLFCTADYCDALGICREGTTSPCTSPKPECEDFTTPNTGRCVECTDDAHCAGNEIKDRCDTVLGECVECSLDDQCEVDDPTKPYCVNNFCKECLSITDCDDIACLQVTCNLVDHTCYYLDDCAVLDGQFCNGVETCDGVVGAGTCLSGVDQCTGSGQSCDEVNDVCVGCTAADPCQQDAHACTTHTCDLDPNLGTCVVTTDDSLCDDGLFCNGPEVCNGQLGCADGPDPCSGATPLCFEVTGSCGDCMSDGDCEDNIGCTADTCVNNLCQNADTCSDGDSCNGVETCELVNATWDCQPGPLQDCWPQPYCWESECVDCVYNLIGAECLSDNDECTEDRCNSDHTCDYVADSDNDGVLNCCDNCPDTIGTADIQCTSSNPGDPDCVCDDPVPPTCPGSQAVEGCSCEQLDADGDGENDCQDDTSCPQ